MYRLAATVRSGIRSQYTPWASPQIKLPTRGGASSLATFKYYPAVSRGHITLPDHDSKAIQDTFEGLVLMAHLRYLSVLSPPFVLFSGSPSHLDQTLGPMAFQSFREYSRPISRCASSPTAASLPVRPMFSRTLPKIRAPITSSQSSPHVFAAAVTMMILTIF
jgi:hypothetical protein